MLRLALMAKMAATPWAAMGRGKVPADSETLAPIGRAFLVKMVPTAHRVVAAVAEVPPPVSKPPF